MDCERITFPNFWNIGCHHDLIDVIIAYALKTHVYLKRRSCHKDLRLFLQETDHSKLISVKGDVLDVLFIVNVLAMHSPWIKQLPANPPAISVEFRTHIALL